MIKLLLSIALLLIVTACTPSPQSISVVYEECKEDCIIPIQLRSAEYDPLYEEPIYIPNITTTEDTGYNLIQLYDNYTYHTFDELLWELNATLLDYFGSESFLIRTNTPLHILKEHNDIRVARTYQPAHRVIPELIIGRILDEQGNVINNDVWTFEIYLYDNKTPVKEFLEEHGSISILEDKYIRARINAELLPELMQFPQINVIFPRPRLFFNDASLAETFSLPVMETLYLTGKGETITVADSGLDTGNIETLHPAIKDNVISIEKIVGDGRDLSGHGTHVTSTIIGNNEFVKGPAPDAKIQFQSVGSPIETPGSPSPIFCFGVPSVNSEGKLIRRSTSVMTLEGVPHDLSQLFQNSTIHTNSFGSCQGHYTPRVGNIDQFVNNNPVSNIILSAGNYATHRFKLGDTIYQRGGDSLGNAARAKNAITVGAVGSLHESATASIHAVTPSSSKGNPTTGRIKPDLVAPGSFITGARSQECVGAQTTRTETETEVTERRIATQRDLCTGRGLLTIGNTTYEEYMHLSGTSMAAPYVAGMSAIVRQYFKEKHNHEPTSALVKATLINGADILPPQELGLSNSPYIEADCTKYPNVCQGWGRINITSSLNIINETFKEIWYADNNIIKKTDDRFITKTKSKPRSITLVWNEQPSHAIWNDLDLVVLAPNGDIFYGNTFAGNESAQNPAYKNKFLNNNNVEKIIIPKNAPQGEYTIIVIGTKIRAQKQPFALIAT